MICYGPHLPLPPGAYIVVCLFAAPSDARADIVAELSVSVLSPPEMLVRCELRRDEEQIVLPFEIDEAMAGRQVEFQVTTRGAATVTLAAAGLYRNRGDVPPTFRTADRTRADERTSARIMELERNIAALHASTSWRVTAPLRRIAALVKGAR